MHSKSPSVFALKLILPDNLSGSECFTGLHGDWRSKDWKHWSADGFCGMHGKDKGLNLATGQQTCSNAYTSCHQKGQGSDTQTLH